MGSPLRGYPPHIFLQVFLGFCWFFIGFNIYIHNNVNKQILLYRYNQNKNKNKNSYIYIYIYIDIYIYIRHRASARRRSWTISCRGYLFPLPASRTSYSLRDLKSAPRRGICPPGALYGLLKINIFALQTSKNQYFRSPDPQRCATVLWVLNIFALRTSKNQYFRSPDL